MGSAIRRPSRGHGGPGGFASLRIVSGRGRPAPDPSVVCRRLCMQGGGRRAGLSQIRGFLIRAACRFRGRQPRMSASPAGLGSRILCARCASAEMRRMASEDAGGFPVPDQKTPGSGTAAGRGHTPHRQPGTELFMMAGRIDPTNLKKPARRSGLPPAVFPHRD